MNPECGPFLHSEGDGSQTPKQFPRTEAPSWPAVWVRANSAEALTHLRRANDREVDVA